MNAPAQIAPWQRYAEAVEAQLPGVFGEQLELRCRLMLARDTASAALWRCTDDETVIMHEIMRLGSLYAFREMPIDALEKLLRAQRRMMQAASALGEFVDALNPQTRETDARGG